MTPACSLCITQETEYLVHVFIQINYNGQSEYTVLLPIPMKINNETHKILTEILKSGFTIENSPYGMVLNITANHNLNILQNRTVKDKQYFSSFYLSTSHNISIASKKEPHMDLICQFFYKNSEKNANISVRFIYQIFPKGIGYGYITNNCNISNYYLYPKDFPVNVTGWHDFHYNSAIYGSTICR
jgi:hypothetical protein